MHASLFSPNRNSPTLTRLSARSTACIADVQPDHPADGLGGRNRSKLVRTFLFVILLAALSAGTGCGSSTTPMTPSLPPPPTTVVVTPATATLYRGETQQFVAQVSGPSDRTVTWSVPPNLGSIDSTGLYTAPAGPDGQSFFVTATSKAVPGRSATAEVTLPSVSFSIAPSAIAILPGGSRTFSAMVVGLNSTQVDWTIKGAGGGTISNTGLYTAPASTGTYSVAATSSANPNYGATAAVLVTTTPSSFSPTGRPQNRREFHTATLLVGGKVLVAGGDVFEAYCDAGGSSAELYDPGLGAFASTGSMADRRYAQTATRLQNGEVLVTGGFSFDSTACFNDGTSPALKSAELYNPSNGSFTSTGSMVGERGGHTATLLNDGKVLIAGGGKTGGGQPPFFGDGLATAELHDPATGVFTSTGNMVSGRVGQTATLLASGKVLIVGGLSTSSSDPVATAELYDPLTGLFSSTGSMMTARAGHAATLLQNGKVLVTGGLNHRSLTTDVDTAEIYDPATGSFLATGSMEVARWAHTSTLLPNGTVLVVGGGSLFSEIYHPSTGSFSISALTESEHSGHSTTLLQDGRVLVIGGAEFPSTAELYP